MFHGFRRLPLGRGGHVGVGIQGEPGAVVTQHAGHRFHVHPILEGQGKKAQAPWCGGSIRKRRYLDALHGRRDASEHLLCTRAGGVTVYLDEPAALHRQTHGAG